MTAASESTWLNLKEYFEPSYPGSERGRLDPGVWGYEKKEYLVFVNEDSEKKKMKGKYSSFMDSIHSKKK